MKCMNPSCVTTNNISIYIYLTITNHHSPAQSGAEHGLLIFLGGPLNCNGYWTIGILLLLVVVVVLYDVNNIFSSTGNHTLINKSTRNFVYRKSWRNVLYTGICFIHRHNDEIWNYTMVIYLYQEFFDYEANSLCMYNLRKHSTCTTCIMMRWWFLTIMYKMLWHSSVTRTHEAASLYFRIILDK